MKRVFGIAIWILTASIVCSAQTTFYFPHIANGVLFGNTWKTTIFLTTPGDASATASGTITFFGDNSNTAAAGAPANISFADEAGVQSAGTIAFTIRGGQSKKYVSAGTGQYVGGFAVVTTTAGTVSGTAVFSQFDPANRLIAEAGVPQSDAVMRQTVFVDTIGGYNVGVAYSNPGTSAASVTLSLLNAGGVTVVPTPVIQTLGPGNHAASFTSQIFPDAGQMTGSMQVSSTVPLAAVALRFDPTFSIFTTLPPVKLASLVQPVFGWFEHRLGLSPFTSVARLLSAFGIA